MISDTTPAPSSRVRVLRSFRAWTTRVVATVLGWLAGETRAVIDLSRVAGPQSDPNTRAFAGLDSGLEVWAGRLARARALALVRRYLCVAAALAVAVASARQSLTLSVPTWSILLPLVSVPIAAIVALARPLPHERVARLLDSRLELKEQLASALEVRAARSSSAPGVLGPRLQQRAYMSLLEADNAWRARPVTSPAEWAAAALLGLFAVVLPLSPRFASPPRVPVATGVSAGQATVVVSETTPELRGEPRIQMRAAVVQAPASSTSAATATGSPAPHGASQIVGRRSVPPTAVSTPRGASGLSGAYPGGTSGTPGQQAGGAAAAGTPLAVQSGAARRLATAAPAGQSPPGGEPPPASSPGQGRAGTSATGRQAAAGPGKSSSITTSSASSSKAASPAGQPPAGAPALPYGGGLRLTPSQLPKPGLITGKGSFQGRGTPGGATAGRSSGSSAGTRNASPSTPSSTGKQLDIQSGYSPQRGTRNTGAAPGKSAAGSGQTSANGGGGPQQPPEIDYVPADAAVVGPSDRALISRYFLARDARQ